MPCCRPSCLWTPPAAGTIGPGTWQTLASMQVPRLYHSTAVLLPDGRVLSTGSGARGNFISHTDYEVFSPPYLFAAGPRPQLTASPVAVKYGQGFSASVAPTTPATTIGKVRLLRLASVTYAFDQNQRGLELSFTQSANTLTIAPPASANDWCPSGHYWLFAVNTAGVPSEGRIVHISASPCAQPTTLTLSVSAQTGGGCTTPRTLMAGGTNISGTGPFYWTLDGVPQSGNGPTFTVQQGLNFSNKFSHRVGVSAVPTCGGAALTAELTVTSYFPDCQPN